MGLFDEWRDRWQENGPGGEEPEYSDEPMEFLPANNLFIENEPLILALDDYNARGDSMERREQIVHAILASTLLVPSETALPEGSWTARIETKVEFMILSNDEGDRAVPVFTDEMSMAKFFGNGAPYVAMSATDLFPLIAQDDANFEVVINPGSDSTFTLPVEWVVGLAESSEHNKPDRISDEDEVLVGFPADPLPYEIKREIVALCELEPFVSAVYEFMWMFPKQDDEPSIVLAIEIDQSAAPDNAYRNGLIKRVVFMLDPVLAHLQRNISLIDLDTQRGTFGELMDTRQPFYRRSIAA